MPYWYLTLPVAGTNAHSNPSAEYNATGWAGTAGGTATRQAGTAAFGAWAVAGTVGAAQGTGVTYGTIAQAAGSYTVSAYVYGGSGSVYSIGIKGTGAGAAFVGSTIGTTGGTWHRYSFSYGESGAANRLFAVVKRSAGADSFLVDGVQVEGGTFLTTYIDGDQEGCLWLGAPQASASQRSGTSRQGGTVIALQTLGLTVLEQGGAGMPPVANIMQEYAVADGGIWQRQRAQQRVFTLTGLMSGTTWPGLHAIRQGVIDAVKINRTPNPQPVRFLYTGAGGTTTIDGYYDGGLAFESRNGFSETAALRFLAPDPYWYATTDEGTQLAQSVALGSANFIVNRDPLGRWGTMGPSGTTLGMDVASIAGVWTVVPAESGTVFVGGDFLTAGGTRAPGAAMWLPSGQWGTMGAGTLNSGANPPTVYAIEVAPSGTVYIGGQLFQGGTLRYAGFWTSAGWGTLSGGTVTDAVRSLALAPDGALYAAGYFVQAAGTTARTVARWNNGWGTLTGGTLSGGTAYALAVSDAGALYVGGDFTTAAGTTARSVAQWTSGAWGSIGSISANVDWLALGLDGRLFAAGGFTSVSGGSALYAAGWNGNQWSALGAGLNANTYHVQVGSAGDVYMTGQFGSAGGVPTPGNIARWNGASWLPLDIKLPATGLTTNIAQASAFDGNGTLYVGGGFYGTAVAASVTAVVNDGAADAYPVLKVRNSGGTTARLVQLVNTTTGDGVYLNLELLPSEVLTLDLRGPRKTLTSATRGNLLGAVLPGSNLTTWKLTPGTNYVSFFASSGTVEASLSWRPRAWSQDDVL